MITSILKQIVDLVGRLYMSLIMYGTEHWQS